MGAPIVGIIPALFHDFDLSKHSLRDINIQTPRQLDSVYQNIRQFLCNVGLRPGIFPATRSSS